MGQASRTTKVLLALGKRKEGGANTEKRAALDATAAVLTAARADLASTFFSRMQTSSASGLPITARSIWNGANASFPPMNCSPGPSRPRWKRQPIPLPGPVGISRKR